MRATSTSGTMWSVSTSHARGLRPLPELQVLRTIIGLPAVLMMHLLRAKQGATQDLLHHDTMLKAPTLGSRVFDPCIATTINVATRMNSWLHTQGPSMLLACQSMSRSSFFRTHCTDRAASLITNGRTEYLKASYGLVSLLTLRTGSRLHLRQLLSRSLVTALPRAILTTGNRRTKDCTTVFTRLIFQCSWPSYHRASITCRMASNGI